MIFSANINLANDAFCQNGEDFIFSSIVPCSNKFLFSNENGLFLSGSFLGGKSAVNSSFISAMSDFGVPNPKRPRYVSIFGVATGPVVLGLYQNIDSTPIVEAEFSFESGETPSWVEVAIPRTVCSRSWAFGFSAKDADTEFAIFEAKTYFIVRPAKLSQKK